MFKTFNYKSVSMIAGLLALALVLTYSCRKIPNNPWNDGCIDKTKINPSKVCPKNLEPVCGCDGKDYGNPCEASKNGVIKYTKGRCKQNTNECIDKNKIDPSRGCPKNYQPVCGCDGKDYGNVCEAEKNGVLKYTNGPCKRNGDDCFDKSKYDPSRACPENYEPVCGCDGKEYGNACEAEKMGIVKYTKGKCRNNTNDSCFDKSKYDPSRLCPQVIEPVCGCDGKTYNNACEAEKNGIVKFVKGRCR